MRRSIRETLDLKEGEVYTLIFREKKDGSKKIREVKKRMRLVKCYTHHAQFESTRGIRRSFGYWETGKLLSGEPY